MDGLWAAIEPKVVLCPFQVKLLICITNSCIILLLILQIARLKSYHRISYNRKQTGYKSECKRSQRRKCVKTFQEAIVASLSNDVFIDIIINLFFIMLFDTLLIAFQNTILNAFSLNPHGFKNF